MDKLGVVATVRIDYSVIDKFIEYYLSIGFDQIIIFIDDTKFNTGDSQYSLNENVLFVFCDDEYWRLKNKYRFDSTPVHEKPNSIEQRQFSNYHYANNLTHCDWLANVDIDELIFSKFDIKSILSILPKNIFSIRVPSFEAVYTEEVADHDIFNTKFFKVNTYSNNKNANIIYRHELLSNGGFWGHKLGKIIARTSEVVLRMTNHSLDPVNEDLIKEIQFDFLKLLHFEGMSCNNFIDKQQRRFEKNVLVQKISSREFKRLDYFKNTFLTEGENGLKNLYKHMHLFDSERLNQAIDIGFLENINFHVKPIKYNIGLLNFHFKKLYYSLGDKTIHSNSKLNDSEVYVLFFKVNGEEKCIFLVKNNDSSFFEIIPSRNKFFINKSTLTKFINVKSIESFFYFEANDQYLISYASGVSSFTSRNLGDWELFEKLAID